MREVESGVRKTEGTVEREARRAERSTWGRRFKEIGHRLGRDKVGVLAGGLAFYGLLGIFPAAVAIISLGGFFLDPGTVESQLKFVGDLLPGGGGRLVTDQLAPIAQTAHTLLGLGIVLGVGGAIWSFSSAISNLFSAMELAYEMDKGRSFLVKRGLAVLFAVGALGGGLVLLVGLIFVPVVAGNLGLGSVATFLIRWGRWLVFVGLVFGGLLLVYRFGVRRQGVRWRDQLWGATFGTGVWVVASILFAVYITYFAHYQRFYGALSTVIILLTWFLLSGFAVLVGAEMNAVLDRERSSPDGRPSGRVGPRGGADQGATGRGGASGRGGGDFRGPDEPESGRDAIEPGAPEPVKTPPGSVRV